MSTSKKIAFGAVTTILALLLVEFALWICGVSTRYETSDPFVGFRRSAPLFVRHESVYRTNPLKTAFFNEQSFPVNKGRNAYRIFCLGGSTTFGHPYDDRTSFCGWLRARLRDSQPERKWEVINCGGISYASYRICRLMQELVRYQPDLFVIYEGHNEFLEDRTYEGLKDQGFVRQVADFVATQTRLGSIAASRLLPETSRSSAKLSAEVDTILDRSRGPELYHRDPVWRQGVIKHCELSFERMCAIARNAGARVILIKPAANLRSFSPFKSEQSDLAPEQQFEWDSQIRAAEKQLRAGRTDLALPSLLRACEIDPHHAMTIWKTGDALFAQRRYRQAEQYFRKALDEDICPLRAVSGISALLERVAERNKVPLIDFPKLLADRLEENLGYRIPGDESFLDHVHPTIEENRRLAWEIYHEISRQGIVRSESDDPERDQRISDIVLKDIDPRRHALALVQVIQVLSWAGKNAEALSLTDRAEALCPGLSDVACYRGWLYEKQDKFEQAFDLYSEAVRRNSSDSLALSRLARAYMRREDYSEAERRYKEAIAHTSESAPPSFWYALHAGYSQCLMAMNRHEEALQQAEIAQTFASSSAKVRSR